MDGRATNFVKAKIGWTLKHRAVRRKALETEELSAYIVSYRVIASSSGVWPRRKTL